MAGQIEKPTTKGTSFLKKFFASEPDKIINVFIAFLALVISTIGLICIYITLRSSEEIDSKNTYLQTYSWVIDIDKYTAEHPKIFNYLKHDTAKLKSAIRDTVKQFANLMFDTYDAVLNNNSYFENVPKARREWEETVGQYFEENIALRQIFSTEISLYGANLRNIFCEIEIKKHYPDILMCQCQKKSVSL